MDAQEKKHLISAHRLHWTGYWTWLALSVAFASFQALLVWTLIKGPSWPIIPLVLLLGFLMHGQLMAFHEAAHRCLVPIGWWNDAVGICVGTLSFMGLTAYRGLHHTHHAYLASERDDELWPFVRTESPRWLRMLALFGHVGLGIVFMPAICLRSFLRHGSPIRNKKVRLRAWFEIGFLAVAWSGIVAMTTWTNQWRILLLTYLVPAVLAGNIQGLRECIEHLCLTGSTALSSTRTVIPRGFLGRLVALSWFNIEYHATHHLYARLPQANLPKLTPSVLDPSHRYPPIFPNYYRAFADLIPKLRDPKVGAQWLDKASPPPVGA
jgi:fatty acid desaturase